MIEEMPKYRVLFCFKKFETKYMIIPEIGFIMQINNAATAKAIFGFLNKLYVTPYIINVKL
jgi:hypothetical protein